MHLCRCLPYLGWSPSFSPPSMPPASLAAAMSWSNGKSLNWGSLWSSGPSHSPFSGGVKKRVTFVNFLNGRGFQESPATTRFHLMTLQRDTFQFKNCNYYPFLWLNYWHNDLISFCSNKIEEINMKIVYTGSNNWSIMYTIMYLIQN